VIAAPPPTDPPTTEAVLQVTENLMGILLAGGFESQDAAWACDIFVLLVTGVASEDVVRRAIDHSGEVDQLYATFAGLPPDRFPLLAANAAEMVAGDADERFRFAIDVVLDGVIARAARR
jgi:Tetracyclin repressor-like, C-terminal domain